ncbi:protein O-mannosyl-transferase TMTC4 isoform X2 [Hyperolius riggenbachi]|uniref:protein O-mannosyl-transferase TMTC4 isoform X2 n=1 Tax=Hyperolius riggenbachi TaxID=752182 RepID=UPI0035A2DBA4
MASSDTLDQDILLFCLSPFWARCLVGVLSFMCFVNSYNGNFVFDDSEAIINNKDLREDSSFGDLWLHDFWGTKLSSNASHKSYRPLTVLTFSTRPTDKGKKIVYAPKSALLSSLFFAVHPVHTECVAGIVGRADLLCALFVVLSFLGYCKSLPGFKQENTSVVWVLLSVFLGAMAMLCKEQGITVLGLNAVFDVFVICKLNMLECIQKVLHRHKTPETFSYLKKGLLTRISILVIGGICVLSVRWRMMGTGPPAFTDVDNPASFADSLLVRVINYNYYYALNGWLLLCPWWLCFDWSMGCIPLIKSLSDFRIMAPAALWFCLFGLMYQALFSNNGQTRRILTMGMGFLIIPFLPASNLFFRVGFAIAERVLYLPSVGYCMLLTYGYSKVCRQLNRKKLVTLAVLGLLAINVLRCVHRSNQWKSEELLFQSALFVCPLNAKVHYNVGKNLADRGHQTDAITFYREAVRLNPKYVHAMNNLGNILKEKEELNEAEQLLSRAVSIQPDFSAAWMNLGIVQNSLKHFEEAEKSYLTAIKYRKKYPDCYYNLGRLYADLNRHMDALNAWRNATILKPEHSLAWNNMIILLDNTGNLAQAEAVGREALKMLPHDHSITFSLANVLGKAEKYKESEGLFLRAIDANPSSASYHGNLAVLYHRWGHLDLAKKHYEISMKLDPSAQGTRENYNLLKRKLEQRGRM